MTLPPAGYHARVVTLGYMANGNGVSSRAILIIYVKVLVGNAITTGHHASAVSPEYPLEEKSMKDKQMKRIKDKNGLGKNASMTGTSCLLTKAPTGNISCILDPHCTQMFGQPLTTSPTYMAWMRSLPRTILPQ
jgi:hypothetical protein